MNMTCAYSQLIENSCIVTHAWSTLLVARPFLISIALVVCVVAWLNVIEKK